MLGREEAHEIVKEHAVAVAGERAAIVQSAGSV